VKAGVLLKYTLGLEGRQGELGLTGHGLLQFFRWPLESTSVVLFAIFCIIT